MFDFSLQMPGNAVLFVVLLALALRPSAGALETRNATKKCQLSLSHAGMLHMVQSVSAADLSLAAGPNSRATPARCPLGNSLRRETGRQQIRRC